MSKKNWKQCVKCRGKISVRVDGNLCFTCNKRSVDDAKKAKRAESLKANAAGV